MQEKVFTNKGNLIIGIYGPLNIQQWWYYTNTSYIFKQKDIKEINFTNFIPTLNKNMEKMYQNCINLKSLNLLSFIISSVESMEYMYFNCIN